MTPQPQPQPLKMKPQPQRQVQGQELAQRQWQRQRPKGSSGDCDADGPARYGAPHPGCGCPPRAATGDKAPTMLLPNSGSAVLTAGLAKFAALGEWRRVSAILTHLLTD